MTISTTSTLWITDFFRGTHRDHWIPPTKGQSMWKSFPCHDSLTEAVPPVTHMPSMPTRRQIMMTSSNGNIFRVTGLLWGEPQVTGGFPSQRPVMRSFDAFFDLRLNKRLSKQPRRRWFETLSRPLWRHCNVKFQAMASVHNVLNGQYYCISYSGTLPFSSIYCNTS